MFQHGYGYFLGSIKRRSEKSFQVWYSKLCWKHFTRCPSLGLLVVVVVVVRVCSVICLEKIVINREVEKQAVAELYFHIFSKFKLQIETSWAELGLSPGRDS